MGVVRTCYGLPRLSASSLSSPLVADTVSPEDGPFDAYLFPGCVMDAWQRDVHRAALRVMRASGARVGLPGRGGDCCGALHTHGGRVSMARPPAKRGIAPMPRNAPGGGASAGGGGAGKN